MLIYNRHPLGKDKLVSSMPSFLNSYDLVRNQAYYSMMLFKKDALNLAKAEELRTIANITGDVNDISCIQDIIKSVDLDEVLAGMITPVETSKSLKQLREEFYERINKLNKRSNRR